MLPLASSTLCLCLHLVTPQFKHPNCAVSTIQRAAGEGSRHVVKIWNEPSRESKTTGSGQYKAWGAHSTRPRHPSGCLNDEHELWHNPWSSRTHRGWPLSAQADEIKQFNTNPHIRKRLRFLPEGQEEKQTDSNTQDHQHIIWQYLLHTVEAVRTHMAARAWCLLQNISI